MKLTKENVYIDLRGKSKEELNLITEITGVENLKNYYYYLHFYTPLNKWIRYHVWTDNIENKTEITIEQLKEILQPMENKEEQLIKEAKERGYTHDNFKCLNNIIESGNPDLNEWYYEKCTEVLYTNSCGNGGQAVYKEGVWAEIVSESLEQQLQKAEAEVKRLQSLIEENKPKVGDVCKFWNDSKNSFIIGVLQIIHPGCKHKYETIYDCQFPNCEKITDQELINKLNELIK